MIRKRWTSPGHLVTGCVCKIISHNDVAQWSLYLDSANEKTKKRSHFIHRRDTQNPHSTGQKWPGGAEQTESGLRTQKREEFNEWMWTDRNERLHVKVYLSHLRWASLHRQLSMGGRHQMTANTRTRITAQANTSMSTKLNKQIMFAMTSVSVRDVCTTESWGSSPDVWAAGHSPTEEESHHIWTTIRKILINMLIW